MGVEQAAGPGAQRPQVAQSMLVGVIVGGREVATVDVQFDGREFLLPLEGFLSFCECHLAESRAVREIVTPLGAVVLSTADIVTIGETEYIHERTLEDRLAIRVLYDSARFALVVDIPWHGRAGARSAAGNPSLVPDVRAPAATISNATVRMRHSRQPSGQNSSANIAMFGRAAGGLWRTRYDDDFKGVHSPSEYAWTRRIGGQSLLSLGHQRVALHPLVSMLELTGAQGAWTNQALDVFQSGVQSAELLPRQLRSRTTISGVGVAAGTAVLRVNDQTVDLQTMGLDGIYEFIEVPVPTSQAARIEVVIFDRHDLAAPIDIQNHSRTASEFLLAPGALVAQGGLGRSGNAIGAGHLDGAAGFLQARYGVSSRLTVEAVAQSQPQRTELAIGGVLRANRWSVVSFAGSRDNGRFGYQLDASYQRDGVRGRMRSRLRQPGPSQPDSARDIDHFFELTHATRSRTLEIGVVGSYRRGLRSAQFLLPTASWRPSTRFFARVRPDFDGRYRLDASWRPDRDWRAGASRSGSVTALELSRNLSRALRVSAMAHVFDEGGSRITALAAWFGSGRRSPSVSAGPMLTNGRIGGVVSLQAEVTPGLLLGAQYETNSLVARPDAAFDHRVTLSLTSSLSFSGGVLPGGLSGAPQTTGGIAGRLLLADGGGRPPIDLRGVAVSIGGRSAVRVSPGGFFRFSNLPEGVYRVTLETARLPIEFNPRESSLLVEVVAGAATRVDFELDVEFGLAGRVKLDGRPVPGALVELLDSDLQVVSTARTDRFGLYRVDAVRVGTYMIRLSPDNAPGLGISWPSRLVEVVDDFLFDQDIELLSQQCDDPEALIEALIGVAERDSRPR